MSMSFALWPRSGGLGADTTGTLGASAKLTPQRATPPPGGTRQASHSKRASAGGWAAAGGRKGPPRSPSCSAVCADQAPATGREVACRCLEQAGCGGKAGAGTGGAQPRADVGGREHQEW